MDVTKSTVDRYTEPEVRSVKSFDEEAKSLADSVQQLSLSDASRNTKSSDNGTSSALLRRSVGLLMEAKAPQGKETLLTTRAVQEICGKYGNLERVIVQHSSSLPYVKISSNAASVAQALRIAETFKDRKVVDFKGIQIDLKVTHAPERVALKLKVNNKYHFDNGFYAIEHDGGVIEYDATMFGRHSARMDYGGFLPGFPVGPLPPPLYPPSTKVAEFWQLNCGNDFPALAEKFDGSAPVSKAEMDQLYDSLLTAICDNGVEWEHFGCLGDEGDDNLKTISGYVVNLKMPPGAIMVVEYVPGGFVTNGFVESKKSVNKQTLAHSLGSISAMAVDTTRFRLRLFGRKGVLRYYTAVRWIYGMTVYREKVFYSRLKCKNLRSFQIMNSRGVFEPAKARKAEQQCPFESVLTKEGYERFQKVINDMDDNIAAWSPPAKKTV